MGEADVKAMDSAMENDANAMGSVMYQEEEQGLSAAEGAIVEANSAMESIPFVGSAVAGEENMANEFDSAMMSAAQSEGNMMLSAEEQIPFFGSAIADAAAYGQNMYNNEVSAMENPPAAAAQMASGIEAADNSAMAIGEQEENGAMSAMNAEAPAAAAMLSGAEAQAGEAISAFESAILMQSGGGLVADAEAGAADMASGAEAAAGEMASGAMGMANA